MSDVPSATVILPLTRRNIRLVSRWYSSATSVAKSLAYALVCRNCATRRRKNAAGCGSIVVIENVFHYKQVIPLRMGDNVIGRYQKGNPINTAFETVDPSVDLNHCTITVSRDKRGQLRYTLSDNNSNTGTFVDNVELAPRERRIIEDGTLFTLGATSIILRGTDIEE